MKKNTVFCLLATILAFGLVFSSCEQEENENTGYGKFVIHNNAASGKTITRIRISQGDGMAAYSPSVYHNDSVIIPPGSKSDEYELALSDWGNFYRVTLTLDNETTIYASARVWKNSINNLYYDGTKLEAER